MAHNDHLFDEPEGIGHWTWSLDLVIGTWSWDLVIGTWSLGLGHWDLVIGTWSLGLGHWSFNIPPCSPVPRGELSIEHGIAPQHSESCGPISTKKSRCFGSRKGAKAPRKVREFCYVEDLPQRTQRARRQSPDI